MTSSPTVSPTAAPSASPTLASVSPTAAPTVDPCLALSDVSTYAGAGGDCSIWVGQNFCSPTSEWNAFMTTNCPQSCCNAAKTKSPTAAAPTNAGISCAGTTDNTAYAARCVGWVWSGYCLSSSTFVGFMQASCAKSCCDAASSCATPASDTTGYAASCSGWQQYCDPNSEFAGFMQSNCATTCCAQVVAPAGCSALTNNQAYTNRCAGWVNAGYCASTSSYKDFMSTSCAQSCCVGADDAAYASQCGGWASSGFCTDPAYSGFMSRSCKASCLTWN